MKEELKNILEFLKENQDYNKELQIRYALQTLGSRAEKFDKLIALLYDTANTQSQPKIDKLAEFFKTAYENKDSFNSFYEFVKYLNNGKVDDNMPFKTLFLALRDQKGWGNKTAALFVKNIHNYHFDDSYEECKIWDDVPQINEKDRLYLPVDAVILAVFNNLYPSHKPKWSFATINKEFQDNFTNEEIILFDDLWFWGFITQKGSKNRDFIWNEEKYWMIKESRKDENTIKEIQDKAEEFLKMTGQCVIDG